MKFDVQAGIRTAMAGRNPNGTYDVPMFHWLVMDALANLRASQGMELPTEHEGTVEVVFTVDGKEVDLEELARDMDQSYTRDVHKAAATWQEMAHREATRADRLQAELLQMQGAAGA